MPRVRSKSAAGVGGGLFATGTYTGNGNATQAIVGVGFTPRLVIIYRQVTGDTPGLKADVDGADTKIWDGLNRRWAYVGDMTISLDADGFTVGDGTTIRNMLNALGVDYTYICWG